MTNFTGQTKSSTTTLNTLSRSTVTQGRAPKAGSGWFYDQSNLTYDALTDSQNGLTINYDFEGTQPTWTTLPKS